MAESQPINVPEDVALNAAFIYENPHVWASFGQFVTAARQMSSSPSSSKSVAPIKVQIPSTACSTNPEMPPLLVAMLANKQLKSSDIARPSGTSGPSGPSGQSGPSGTFGPSGTNTAPSGAFTTASRDASPTPSTRSVAATKRPGSALTPSSDEEVLPELNSCDDDFIPVVHRKKKKSKARQILSATPSPAASDSEANHATASSRRASTETLCPSTSPMDVSAPRSPRSPRSAKPPSPPPSPRPSSARSKGKTPPRVAVSIAESISVSGLFLQLRNVGIGYYHSFWQEGKKLLNIYPNTINDHRALTGFLTKRHYNYQSHPLPEERVYGHVIRGIPTIMSLEEVKSGLIEKGINPLEVHRMHRSARTLAMNPKLGRDYDMVLVVLKSRGDVNRLYEITDISGLNGFTIEAPHRKKGQTVQCHNCQAYGHTARGCRLKSKCVKCAGDHSTWECSRPKDITQCTEPPACTNCDTVGHTASYRGCVKAPKRKTSAPKAAPKATPNPEPEFRLAPAPTRNPWVTRDPRLNRLLATSGAPPAAAMPTPAPVSTVSSAPNPAASAAPVVPTPTVVPVTATVEVAAPLPIPQPVPQAVAPITQIAPIPISYTPTQTTDDDIWDTVRALTSPESLEYHAMLADCCHRLRALGRPDTNILNEIFDIQRKLRQHTLNIVFASSSP